MWRSGREAGYEGLRAGARCDLSRPVPGRPALIDVWQGRGASPARTSFSGATSRVPLLLDRPRRAAPCSCNTATSEGLSWRAPRTPFVMETFCIGDHGIIADYRAETAGQGRAGDPV